MIVKIGISIVLMLSFSEGSRAASAVDDRFLQEFSHEIRPQIRSMCERYDAPEQENGIYWNQYALGLNTFIGLKSGQFEILSFTDRTFLPEEPVQDIVIRHGQFAKIKNWLNLRYEKPRSEHLNDENQFQRFYHLNTPSKIFLIDDIQNLASSISWSNTMGLQQGILKKIHCHHSDFQAYQAEDEVAPDYQQLPDELQALVLEQPLHLKVKSADDIRAQLKAHDDPETPIEQVIQLYTPDARKLFQNQSICILRGQGKGWHGFIENPRQPYTTASILVYQFDDATPLNSTQPDDVVTTSEQECESID